MAYHGEEPYHYNLEWSKSAEKTLEKVGKTTATEIRHKIKSNLTKNEKDSYPSPTNKNVKALKGNAFKGMYRYRFGKYRAHLYNTPTKIINHSIRSRSTQRNLWYIGEKIWLLTILFNFFHQFHYIF